MSFARVEVQLGPPPAASSAEEDELCLVLEGLRESPVVRQGMLHRGSEHPAAKAAQQALRSARERVEALERYGVEACEAIGKAWLDAGAPGSPRLKAEVDARLERARHEWSQRYAALWAARETAVLAAEARDGQLQRDEAEAQRAIGRLDLLLELVETSQTLIADGAISQANRLVKALPAPLTAELPQDGDAKAVIRWLEGLRHELAVSRDEALLEAQKVLNRRLRNIADGVGSDIDILEGVRSLWAVERANDEKLRHFLADLGEHLLPHVVTFTHGPGADEALRLARERHAQAAERVAALEDLLGVLAR